MSVLTAEVQSHIYRIYDSINDVSPADWQRLTGNALDLGMDPRMIRVLEETLADQCRMWTMMVEDPTGVVVACACLCLFVVDALVAAPLAVRKIAEFIRTVPCPRVCDEKSYFPLSLDCRLQQPLIRALSSSIFWKNSCWADDTLLD
jgi:hypothetical protein